MSNKSYWIWHYGEFEIYHTMQVHLRREERGCHRPLFWKISTPYATAKFIKTVTCESGYLLCRINGDGYVSVDGRRYPADRRIALDSGTHSIEIQASNPHGFPAIFVESDAAPSDGSWESNYFAGEFKPVGWNPYFDSADKNPEVFPFEYTERQPLSVNRINGGMLYDFGTELFGYINITDCNKSERFDIFYGESEAEALDTEYSYITDSLLGSDSYRLKQRAFRYIYIPHANENITVTADYEYLPLEKIGDFQCDDPLFNSIYSASVRTFHLNCREAFLDGIKRDRWVWSGDAYQSARINKYLFFDRNIEQRTLLGLIGKEPFEQHINTILDYSLLWFISLYEHYSAYGDKSFIKRIYPLAERLIAFCETRLNSDGFIEGRAEDWTFIDWADIEKTGAVCAEQMLLLQTYFSMYFLAHELEVPAADEFLRKYEALKSRVNEYYWNAEKGAFIDSYVSGNCNVTRHANIFAVMYDIATEEQAQSICDNVLNNPSVPKITTPYFMGYELDVLAKLGRLSAVEEVLRSYWGGMLALGADTVWEEYRPDIKGNEHYAMYGGKYEKSLCHAWGAGPIYLWGRYYLGVQATAPGYVTFTVRPQLGGLKQISGTVPVNGGMVAVSLDENKLEVTATKSGGILAWKDREYRLIPNEKFVLLLN